MRSALSRWPRPLRVIFVVWLIVGTFGFFFSIPLAIVGGIVGAPNVLPAGYIDAALDQYSPLVALALGLPAGLLFLLAKQREAWHGWHDAAQRAVMAFLLLIAILFFGELSARTITENLALSTNAIVEPPLQAWPLRIVAVKLDWLPRNCAKRLYFDDPIARGHRSEICVAQNDPLVRAEPGDVLRLSGRSGPFGITYQRDDLRLEKVTSPPN